MCPNTLLLRDSTAKLHDYFLSAKDFAKKCKKIVYYLSKKLFLPEEFDKLTYALEKKVREIIGKGKDSFFHVFGEFGE